MVTIYPWYLENLLTLYIKPYRALMEAFECQVLGLMAATIRKIKWLGRVGEEVKVVCGVLHLQASI